MTYEEWCEKVVELDQAEIAARTAGDERALKAIDEERRKLPKLTGVGIESWKRWKREKSEDDTWPSNQETRSG